MYATLSRSYGALSAAEESWLAATAGQAIILPSNDVWGIVASAKSTAGLSPYTLVWLYTSEGQRPDSDKNVVSVDSAHPNYETFVQQLKSNGRVVSLREGTTFASTLRTGGGTGKGSESGTVSRVYTKTGTKTGTRTPTQLPTKTPTKLSPAATWFQNPWVVGGISLVVVAATGAAIWYSRKRS